MHKLDEINPISEMSNHEQSLDNKNALRNKNRESLSNRENLIVHNVDRFSRENFSVENSYDAKANELTRELIKIGTVPIEPMGSDGVNRIDRLTAREYSKKEIEYLKLEREKIDAPTENTVMQKIIGVYSGNIKEDLRSYIEPKTLKGTPTVASIYGFVAKADDSVPFSNYPQKCYENFRLDYAGTEYRNINQPVYIVRFTDGKNYVIPFNKDFDGVINKPQPFQGSGYIGNDNLIIPEYIVAGRQGAIVTDGVIYKITPDGKEEAVAFFDEDSKKFKLYGEGIE